MAESATREKLLDSIATLESCPHSELIIREGRLDLELLPLIEQRDVDTVVMGMRSRTGLGAMFIGNTSERLLPEMNCSVLAVKPEDQESRV